jgi:hypothetical protein
LEMELMVVWDTAIKTISAMDLEKWVTHLQQ